MMLKTCIATTLMLLNGSYGFAPMSLSRPASIGPLSMTQKLSDIDEMCIENVAELCLKADAALAAECDLEEYEALVNQLQDQRDLLDQHVKHIDHLLGRLRGEEGINGLAVQEEKVTYFAG